ncbi:MAG: hypothetical protein KJ077_10915 [Anaerolineae bacterium]|nr:hypothetical protein [Anaerolineae bacterium]
MKPKPIPNEVIFCPSHETGTAVVRAMVEKEYRDGPQFLARLKTALTQWVNTTENGRKAWAEAAEDFNVGDLSLWQENPVLVEILKAHGLHELKVEVIATQGASDWVFDTVLVNWDELEENDEAWRNMIEEIETVTLEPPGADEHDCAGRHEQPVKATHIVRDSNGDPYLYLCASCAWAFEEGQDVFDLNINSIEADAAIGADNADA